jgi:hypothetical protein
LLRRFTPRNDAVLSCAVFPAKAGSILILRQAQDEDDWKSAGLSLFLMLSLSKH